MNENLVAYYSGDKIDNIIFSAEQTLTVNNTVSSTPQQFTINTQIGEYGRPLGIYSTDNGSTWTDMGNVSESSSSMLAHATKPPLVVTPGIDSYGSMTIKVTVNALVGSGSTFSLLVGVCALAVDSPGSLSNIPVLSGKTALASISTTGNVSRYRKILFAQTYTMPSSIGSPYYVTVAHNLGFVPTVQIWYNDQNSSNPPDYLQGTIMAAGAAGVTVDSTNLYLYEYIASAHYLIRCYAA